MSIVIHLGVIEQKYANNNESVGTGDVASILEARYDILHSFYNAKKDLIAQDITRSVKGAIQTAVMGGPVNDMMASAKSRIATRAKQYISSQEVEKVLSPGSEKYPVPTQAALDGIKHRFKKPRTGRRRPSFIDTGLYESSLIAWTD